MNHFYYLLNYYLSYFLKHLFGVFLISFLICQNFEIKCFSHSNFIIKTFNCIFFINLFLSLLLRYILFNNYFNVNFIYLNHLNQFFQFLISNCFFISSNYCLDYLYLKFVLFLVSLYKIKTFFSNQIFRHHPHLNSFDLFFI